MMTSKQQAVLAAGLFAASILAGCRGRTPTVSAENTAQSPESGVKLVKLGSGSGIQLDAAGLKLAGVTTITAGVSDLAPRLQPVGDVSATDSGTVQVTSRLPGRIAAVYVSAGQRVRSGQVLAVVDSVDLTQAEATYQTAVQHLRLTYNQLQQQKQLARYGTLSEPAIEDARRTFAAAQASVNSDRAQIDLDKLTLTNTQQLVSMGEVTRKPVEDAQNAYAQAQAAAIQAQVTLKSTKANLDRAKILYDNGIYSKQQYEDAETAYNNAVAAGQQTATQEQLSKEELGRQQNIFKQNLNGAASLQAAQSKLQQDQHTYNNDLTALALARTALKRAQVVRKSGIPISQALQQAQDAYDEARAAVQGATNTLKLYGLAPGAGTRQLANGHVVIPVIAPLEGIIASRTMVTGQMTDTSTPLAKIVNLDRVYVNAQVYEQDLTDVSVGSPARVRVAAFPSRIFNGTVSFIGREVSPDTRTITVRAAVDNPGWLLRPGMFATIDIRGRGGRRALTIPEQALLQEPDGQAVYVEVADRTFARRTVKVGPASGGQVPVYSGLAPGDRVVRSGNLFLDTELQKLESEKRGAA